MLTRRDFLKGTAGITATAALGPIIAGCSTSGSASAYGSTISEMSDQIRTRLRRDNIPGLSIALVDDQNVVWAEGFGYADAASGIPATADTLYEIGSVSKVFTACLVMQLAEKGLLNLDDPLTHYIPDFSLGQPLGSFPDLIKPITIRSILTHHSGIPGDIWNGLFARKFDPDFNKKLLAVLKDDCAHYPVDFFLMYSNTAVSLLSDVIARAAGKSFESCSDTFFSDLGMKHTSFYTDRPAVSDNRARGYYQGMPYGPFYANGPAAGSMISSVRDIAQFIRMMNARGKTGSGEVLEAQTLETMISRQNGNIPLDFDFQTGMMWKLTEPELAYAGRLCLHTGDRLFFQSYLEILTDHKLGVIVIANAVESAYGAQAEIAQKTLQLALAQKTGLNPPATPPVPAASPAESWPMDWLNNIAGIYSPLDDPTVVGTSPGKHYDRIIPAADGSGLQWTRKVNSTGQQVVLLVPRADGRFSPAGSQEYEYEFRPIENRIVMIQHHWGASWFMAERYVPATIPQTWQDRQGNYLLDNLDPEDWNLILPENLRLVSNRLELRVESDVLVMKLLDGLYAGELVVAPFSDILGYMPGGGRNLAGSVKAVMENGVVYLQFLGLRYKKIS